MENSRITSTRHILPFGNLSDEDFERLCYWVVSKSSDYDEVEHYGMSGDKKRDVIGYKHKAFKKREQWYFQCKRYKKISASVFEKELDEIKRHSGQDENFEPDAIVFITACSVTPSCKDKVKKYAKDLNLGWVYFWTNVELDEKAKATRVEEEFFKGGIDTDKLGKIISENIKIDLLPSYQQSGQAAGLDYVKTDEINKQIDEIVKIMESNKVDEAKGELLVLLGKLQDKDKNYAHELGRIYNNLGVCFNRPKNDGGDFEKAEEYFNLALKVQPNFSKAAANRASVFLNKGGEENYRKAYDITISLWNGSDKNEPLLLQVLIWSIYHYQGEKKVFEFYDNSSEAKCLVAKDWRSLNLIGTISLSAQDFKKANELADLALELASNAPQNLFLKARILMARSQKENIIPSLFEVVPRFRDYKDVEIALNLLESALEGARPENNHFFEEQIKTDILICKLWLRRVNEAQYKEIRFSIDLSRLDPHQQEQLHIQDIIVELHSRNFESAYNMLEIGPEWKKVDYREKMRIGHIFLMKGAPQYAKKIFNSVENEAGQNKDVQFWIDMSLAEVLLSDKVLAIQAAQMAKDYAAGTEKEKMALSHFNAMMLRYASSGETDRLMEGMFDYDKRYPDDKAVRPIKAVDEDGNLTDELKSILLRQKKRYENIRETYRTQPVISYFLEETFGRPYADILSRQNDPEFIIELINPNEEFIHKLAGNLENTKSIVFDYSTLLNLSKMNLLGLLSKFGKRIYIVEELFDKIQYELLVFEQEDLRRLWDFLRSSKEIEIVEGTAGTLTDEKMKDVFEPWIINSIKLSKEKEAILTTDDLRFLTFLYSESVKGCNSLIILKEMLSRKWIDNKVYSTSLGDLAERFYTFLSFTGENFFQIVMEDKVKITPRTYHLVNQMFLPGANIASFTNVFVAFIDLLWKTGSLPEDKVEWLVFLTEKIIELIEKQGGIQNKDELKKVAPDFVKMWIIAIRNSGKDEIAIMEKKIDGVFTKLNMVIFKENIKRFILAKKNSFTKR